MNRFEFERFREYLLDDSSYWRMPEIGRHGVPRPAWKPVKTMTNFEKIKAMSAKEFAEAFGGRGLCDYIQDECGKWCDAREECGNCIKEWLNKEVEE